MTRCNAASPAYKWCVSILVENTPLNLCHIFALQLQKVPCCPSPYNHSVCLLIIGSHADAEQLSHLPRTIELLPRTYVDNAAARSVKLCFVFLSHSACPCEFIRFPLCPAINVQWRRIICLMVQHLMSWHFIVKFQMRYKINQNGWNPQ